MKNIKMLKTMCFILSILMCCSLVVPDLQYTKVCAAESQSGSCSDSISWSLDDKGVLTISGTGDIPDKDYQGNYSFDTLKSSLVNKIVINKGITGIGHMAFENYINLTSINIPSTVEKMGSEVFYACYKLSDVIIADNNNISYIDGVFYDMNSKKMICSIPSVTKITIPDTIKIIGEHACSSCDNLLSVTIPEGVEKIEKYAFWNTNISKVNIPVTVDSIELEAFALCEKLKEINVYNSKCEFNGGASLISSDNQAAFSGIIRGFKNSTAQQYASRYNRNFESLNDTRVEYLTGYYNDDGNWKYYPGYGEEDEIIYYPSDATFSDGEIEFYLNDLDLYKGDDLVIYVEGEKGDTIRLQSTFYNNNGTYSAQVVGVIGGTVLNEYGKNIIKLTSEDDAYKLRVKLLYERSAPEAYAVIRHIKSENDTTSNVTTTSITTTTTTTTTSSELLSSGMCGDNVKWDYENGQLRISGYGEMFDYTYEDTPFSILTDLITTVVIEEGIESIGECSFYKCDSLESVTLPSSLKSIGSDAFYECKALKEISIPDNVTEIKARSFYDCTNLKEIMLPFKLKSIETAAFIRCSSLIDFHIPETVNEIGEYAFCGCSSLKDINIPKSVKEIGSNAFSNCDKLESVTINRRDCIINDSELTICNSGGKGRDYKYEGKIIGYPGSSAEEYAIKYNKNFDAIKYSRAGNCGEYEDNVTWKVNENSVITISGTGNMGNYSEMIPSFDESRAFIESVIIENGVTSIGSFAFEQCMNLESVLIPKSVKKINSCAFGLCRSLNDVKISEGLQSIEGGAFEFCDSLKKIELPESLWYIGDSAFDRCSSLIEVRIPNSVNTIGKGAFSRCSALKTIIIPENVINIGEDAFYDCPSVTIKGYKNSRAEEYAKENNIPFEEITVETTSTLTTTSTTNKTTTTTSSTTIRTTATTTLSITSTTTLSDDNIKEKFILKLAPLAFKVYDTDYDIKTVTSTDNSIAVSVVSSDKRHLNVTGANNGYAEITVELVNGDKYLIELTVGGDNGNVDTQTTKSSTSTTTSVTTKTSQTTTTTSTATKSTTTTTITTTSETTMSPTTTTTTVTVITSSAVNFDHANDAWQFKNDRRHFIKGGELIITEKEAQKLEQLQKLLNKPTMNKLINDNIKNASGACFGMGALDLICLSDRDKFIPLLRENAENIRSIILDDELKSKINFLSLMQLLPEIRYNISRSLKNESDTDRLKRMLSSLDSGPVLVCYRRSLDEKGGAYAHAVVAYEAVPYTVSENDNMDFINSLNYEKGEDELLMVKVYDPRDPNYNESCNIFINIKNKGQKDEKYFWNINLNYQFNIAVSQKAILYVEDDMSLMQELLFNEDMSNVKLNTEVAIYPELNLYINSDNEEDKKFDILYNNGTANWWIGADDNKAEYELFPMIYGEEEPTANRILLDIPEQEYYYKYINGNGNETSMEIFYSNAIYSIDCQDLKAIKFSPESVVLETEENTAYRIDAVRDDITRSNEFYDISISGISSGKIELKFTDEHWVLSSASELGKVTVSAANKNGDSTLETSLNNSSVLIQYKSPTPADKTKIGIYNNSGYVLEGNDSSSSELIGDVNEDKIIDGRDATAILTDYAKTSTGQASVFNEDQKTAADVNKDSIIDGRDATSVLSYYAYISAHSNYKNSLEEYLTMTK